MRAAPSLVNQFTVNSPNVTYTDDAIVSDYDYQTVKTTTVDNNVSVEPVTTKFTFKTDRKVPKLGVMIVGLGGNNGSTVVAGVIANREKITWRTNKGVQQPNYWGSVTQASTLRLGADEFGNDVYIPFNRILPVRFCCLFIFFPPPAPDS